MKEHFISWLEVEKPKSVRHYTSGFNTIEKILDDNDLLSLEKWNLKNYDIGFDKLKSLDTFKKLNSSGNSILTATLSNFKKFMTQINDTITPVLPFDSFGWKWASTGIASHLNNPKSLKIILDALLINGNGENNYTENFKNLIHKLCVNKYSITEEESDKLTKLSNPKEEKNIIENSANYWFHIGLLESTGKNAIVSNLGEKFLNGLLSNDEFILDRIDNYFLPNKAYKNTEISKWDSANLKIYPFKLLQNIFLYLFNNYEKSQQYITENELSNIIIPCSCNLDEFKINKIANHIIEYRKNPGNYSTWPKPQSNYIDDKGLRMANEFLYFLEVFDFLSSNKNDTIRSSGKKYMAANKFIDMNESEKNIKTISFIKKEPDDFKIQQFITVTKNSGLSYSDHLITRYVSSLVTKPFVLLSGLSGSGKTKLAQAFAQWISENESQYCIVPVGADWTNREPLLGYVNALDNSEYILPENGALELIIKANKDENQNKPYFLILDEMNLSHVERYFADFLSVMESNDKFKLHSSESNLNITDGEKHAKSIEVPSTLNWPKNLFVVGTVNIDETTYMFSPKVLDRANVIEFRVSEEDLKNYFDPKSKPLDMNKLWEEGSKIGLGAKFGEDFVKKSIEKPKKENLDKVNNELIKFFNELQIVGNEFGYRSASEIQTLFRQIDVVNPDFKSSEDFKKYSSEDDYKIDIAIMQKLLPKLHGSRRKLSTPLTVLANLCLKEDTDNIFKEDGKINITVDKIKFPLSFYKIARMYKSAIENGFASYAEA